MKAEEVVSDHALIRWLERAHEIEMEWFRQRLFDQVSDAVRAGASGVRVDGLMFVIKDGRVVTVLRTRETRHTVLVAIGTVSSLTAKPIRCHIETMDIRARASRLRARFAFQGHSCDRPPPHLATVEAGMVG